MLVLTRDAEKLPNDRGICVMEVLLCCGIMMVFLLGRSYKRRRGMRWIQYSLIPWHSRTAPPRHIR